MRKAKYSRRTFLKATGVSPFLVPLVEPDLARAGCLTDPPRRALFVLWQNGIIPGNGELGERWPTEAAPAFTSGLSSLEPHRSDLIFIDKMNYQFMADSPVLDTYKGSGPVDGHMSHQGHLTATRYSNNTGSLGYPWDPKPTGPSLDQYLGQELARRGFGGVPGLSNGVLYTGVRCLFPCYAVWKAAGSPVAPVSDPATVFSSLFSGRAGVAPDPAFVRLQNARKSVLDSVGRDMDRFSRRLGTDDRARIARHLDSVRDMEKALTALRQGTACPAPDLDVSAAGITPTSSNQQYVCGMAHFSNPEEDMRIPKLLEQHINLLVAALATDVVRVAVFQLTDGLDWWSLPWLRGADGAPLLDNYHYIAHGQTSGVHADKLIADKWIYSQWASLIGKLKNEKEGGKSLLDSSVVAFMNGMSAQHDKTQIPSVLAGSCGGYFKTGRCVTNRNMGTYHNPLLVSIASAMGMAPPNNSWGDSEYNSGEMIGLRG